MKVHYSYFSEDGNGTMFKSTVFLESNWIRPRILEVALLIQQILKHVMSINAKVRYC
jgi:hypothetical protein